MTRPRHVISVDVGGTFTDLALFDIDAGRALGFHKLLTDRESPSGPVLDGIEELLAARGVRSHEVARVVHSTTLVTNAIIERAGARTALITTRGFRDVLEIGTEQMYDIYDLFAPYPEPLVPRELRFEVDERLDAHGRVVRPLDESEAITVTDRVAAAGVEAVAVSLLHSFRHPGHEQRLKAVLNVRHPDLSTSLSSDVAPVIGEYERTVTVVVDAYTKPLLRRYMSELLERLEQRLGLPVPVYVVLSTGGVATAQAAAEMPVRLLESGPAAGAFGASHFASLAGHSDIVSFDLGGTTAKACVIEDGHPMVTWMLEADRQHRFKRGSGLPIMAPTVDLIEVGAGGGSIARVDELGLLRVGPDSASSDPGPACYRLGGSLPTVTDANLVLGYLSERGLLGGRIRLDRDRAEAAIVKHIAEPLGLTLIEAAHGIHAIANENMARAARTHILERNRDPRRLAVVAFGGGGPTHAHGVARLLGASRVIIPLGAGVGSAVGALIAPLDMAFGRSYVTTLSECDWDEVARLYEEMRREATRALNGAAGGAPVELAFAADMRFAGQHHHLRIELPDRLGREVEREIEARFRDAYRAVYGREPASLEPDVVTWYANASTEGMARLSPAAVSNSSSTASPKAVESRPVCFVGRDSDFVETLVLDRGSLPVGWTVRGPAIVEEAETTIVVPPRAVATVDSHLSLVVDLAGDEG